MKLFKRQRFILLRIFMTKNNYFYLVWCALWFVFLLLCFSNHNKFGWDLNSWYGQWFDPLVTVITVITALVIAYDGYVREMISSLPMRLNVHFMYNGQYLMSCREAYLAGPDDIRQWSQTIGKEMIGVYLDFYPYMKQETPKEIYEPDNEHRLFEIRIYLRKPPKPPKPPKPRTKNIVIPQDQIKQSTVSSGSDDFTIITHVRVNPTNNKAVADKNEENSAHQMTIQQARKKILQSTDIYIIWEDNNIQTEGNDEILIEGYQSEAFFIPADGDERYNYYCSKGDSTIPDRRVYQLAENSKIDNSAIEAYLQPRK